MTKEFEMSEEKVTKALPLIAGLDIGTTKVVVVVAEISDQNLEVIGKGEQTHSGVKQGSIINIEEVSDAIKKAKEEAEIMSARMIDSVWVSVSGTHIQSFDSLGMVIIQGSEVENSDIENVIKVARTIAIPSDRTVLHVIPKEFKVDHQEGIVDPLGMSGVRLESSVHMITGCSSTLRNTKKCVERSGFRINGLVIQQLASAEAVLTSDEKKMGVSLIDLGGGTCDVISFDKGSVNHVSVVPVGGQNFIQDIALGLKTTQKSAYDLLKQHGNVLKETVCVDETIEVDSIGEDNPSRTISKAELSKIVSARAEETIGLLKKVISDEKMESYLGSGVVFTGGLSQLDGFIEVCDYLLDLPVRKGSPRDVRGMVDIVNGPSYATAIGMIKYGAKTMGTSKRKSAERTEYLPTSKDSAWTKLRDYFTDVF